MIPLLLARGRNPGTLESMRIDEVLGLLKHRPFDPFTICMSDGSNYPVRHPDQVILTPRAIYVGTRATPKNPVAQEVVICDLVHVTRLVPGVRRGSKRRSA